MLKAVEIADDDDRAKPYLIWFSPGPFQQIAADLTDFVANHGLAPKRPRDRKSRYHNSKPPIPSALVVHAFWGIFVPRHGEASKTASPLAGQRGRNTGPGHQKKVHYEGKCTVSWTVNGAGTIMLSADYYRRQADVCVRLSVVQSDEAISRRLIILAKAYKDEADDMARSAQAAEVGHRRDG